MPSDLLCFSCLTVVICATLTSWKVFSNVLSLVCFMMKERWSIGCMSRLILLNNLLPMQLLAPRCKVCLLNTTLVPTIFCACVHQSCAKLILGIPANPKRDHHWVKAKSSKSVFCQHIFNSMPKFFAHHQMDLAQRDGKKMLLAMITAVSRILCLDFDFPENYTHINQVSNIVCTFPNQSRHVCVH